MERQSAGNARLNALNEWYSGQLEAKGLEYEASQEWYNSLVAKRNATMGLIGGGIHTGTALLMGASQYGAYRSGGINALNALNQMNLSY